MQGAGGSSANQNGNAHSGTLHFNRYVHHFCKRGRNQSAEAYGIGMCAPDRFHDLLGGNHHAEVDDFITVAGKNHRDDVLSDVVNVALHRCHHDLSCLTLVAFRVFGLGRGVQERLQNGDGLLHGSRGLHHLGQEHLSFTEQATHLVHRAHERTFDDVDGLTVFLQGFHQVALQMFAVTFAKCQAQPFLHAQLFSLLLGVVGGRPLFFFPCQNVLTQLNQVVCGMGASVQHHVFQHVELCFGNVAIGDLRCWVHDAEVHSCTNSMIEEHGMHGLANVVVAPEGERQVAHAAAHVGTRQVLANPGRSPYEVLGVGVVFFHSRCNRKNVRVEDDVLRPHADLLGEDAIAAGGDCDASFVAGGLSLFVEAHHHYGCSHLSDVAGVRLEDLLALLERDGVHDALSLHALQTRHDDIPVGRVNHHRHARNIGIGDDEVQESLHLMCRIEQAVVHVDIKHQGAVGHLFAGDAQSLVVVFLVDESQEFARACYVATLTNIHKRNLGCESQGLQAC